MQVQGVLETSLYVDDLEAAEEFYTRVLCLRLHSVQENRHVFFHCGSSMLLLFNPLESALSESAEESLPTHGSDGPGHVALAVAPEELSAWRGHLATCGVPIER
ncbi:MAG: VOC family protein, partial [Planctomycetota bacterium]